VQPLGSNAPPERVDVRLICATNRDLEGMVRAGTFRDDLYYRLSVMTLELPPLRRYQEHLEVLASVFAEEAASRHGKRAPRIAPATMALLAAYGWPGNVRELRNAIEHAVILCTGDELRPEDLPRSIHATPRATPARSATRPTLRELREQWLAPLERRYFVELLGEHGGNVRAAAAAAGVDPVTLYRLMKRRGVAMRRQAGFEEGGADDAPAAPPRRPTRRRARDA
jgi:DNA-binding NtrC family response regulator